LEDYTSDSISTTFPPFREAPPAVNGNNNFFHGPLKEVVYGKNLRNFKDEKQSFLPRPFRLRFVIPNDSDKRKNGDLVGLAEVADGSTEQQPLSGHVGLRVYRANLPLKGFNSNWTNPINSANLHYIATLGKLPTLPDTPGC